jgi:TolB-like protein/Tfp pilus assembly protein PilF
VRLDEKVARFTLALPDKPSIAVLPFQNMSGDPQQDYFADGVVEDIITALSRIRWLFVIARNSSFTYKGRALDIKQIGRELGVRYVLEGGIRKAGARVRITGQLIDAVTGTHIWAERFEGDLVDIFELQDRITSSVVGAIEPALRTAEILRVQAKPTSSLDAYDYFLRASAATHGLTRADYAEALLLCKKAIATDPHYASAYGLCAWIYLWRCVQSWTDQPEEERAEALKLARSAVEFGGENPEALWMAGHVISFFAGDGERGMELIRRSLSLNPNSAHAHTCAGYVGWHLGQGDTAVEHFQRAFRLSPLDHLSYQFSAGTAWGHFVAGRYQEAVEWADRALREQPNWIPPLRAKIAACGLLGRIEETTKTLQTALNLEPDACRSKAQCVGADRRRSQITSSGFGSTSSTMVATMCRGVRNWPFWPAEAIFASIYS